MQNKHDIELHCADTDFHSTQIIKSVARKYLRIRMARYGQDYTKDVLQKTKLGKRRQLNKLVHFQGLQCVELPAFLDMNG